MYIMHDYQYKGPTDPDTSCSKPKGCLIDIEKKNFFEDNHPNTNTVDFGYKDTFGPAKNSPYY